MPTYVYECRSCNKVTELDQRISEPPLKDCTCGPLGTLVRLIQPTAVMFKGGGFHINDYSSDQSKNADKPCGDNCACASGDTPD